MSEETATSSRLADLFAGRHIEPLLGRIRFIPEADLRLYYHDEIAFRSALRHSKEQK